MHTDASGRRHTDPLDVRLDALDSAARLAEGRLDRDAVVEVAAVVERTRSRLRLSADHTVVALAGATGSGKSSLFNRLCGLDIAEVGSRRPTTSWTLACAWGDGAGELLDRLDVPSRHRVQHESSLDLAGSEPVLAGLVLLDLPDHDSTEVEHHVEVARLVELVDVMIWVVDPQKYADAALHETFLRRLARHQSVVCVAFNQVDRLSAESIGSTVDDVRRLLAADGLGRVPVIVTSAVRGDGLDELRAEIARRVGAKRSVRDRALADIAAAADRLESASEDVGPADAASPDPTDSDLRAELVAACASAAGVPQTVVAVERSFRTRSIQATGWPITRWASRLRPDPLPRAARASLRGPSPVQQAELSAALRQARARTCAGLPGPWRRRVGWAPGAPLDELTDALASVVSNTPLRADRGAWWWTPVRMLQWVLLGVAIVGAGWLLAVLALSLLAIRPEPPQWLGLPVPAWLLAGSLLAGWVVALVARALGRRAARRRANRARDALIRSVGLVVDELVVAPLRAEVVVYRDFRSALDLARHS